MSDQETSITPSDTSVDLQVMQKMPSVEAVVAMLKRVVFIVSSTAV